MKQGILALALLAVSGCAFVQSISVPPPAPDVSALLSSTYANGPVQQMFTRYGAPLRQTEASGAMIYSWDKSTVMYFGTQPPLPVQCQMDAYVTPSGTVTAVNVSGQMGACELFMP